MASTPGKGTRMSFVPTRPASTTAQLATSVEAVWSMRSLRVRVVEANNINRKLLNIMREQLGHIAFAVADGETAISHCR